MPMSVLGGPDATRLLAPRDAEPGDHADHEHSCDKKEPFAHDLCALDLLAMESLGL